MSKSNHLKILEKILSFKNGFKIYKIKIREIKSLNEVWQNSSSSRARNRTHALLLSNKRTDIKALSKIFFVHQDTIGDWLLRWEKDGMSSLLDIPRTGRRPIFTTDEKKNRSQS